MKLWLACPLALAIAFAACGDEENGLTTDPYPSDPNDPVICIGDPDTTIVCKKQSEFWDCSTMPNGEVKCSQKEPVVPPGGAGWTCKAVAGKVVCTTDKKDAGPSGDSDWSCVNNPSGGTTCEKAAPVPPGGGTWNCGYDKEFNWHCTKVGGPAADAGTGTDSGTVTPPPQGSGKTCFKPDTTTTLPTPPEGSWAIITANKVLYNKTEALYVKVHFSKAFVDNTYGSNAFAYSNGQDKTTGHSFGDLEESDKAEVFFNNANGDLLMHMAIDYISKSATAKSGYGCLGVTGGEGQMLKGSASDVLAAQSSLATNFNQYGYVLLDNSPATDKNYTANKSYPKWIFDVWYEVWVKWSVFGKIGPGKVYITGIHASPSKVGDKTLKVVPYPCPPGT